MEDRFRFRVWNTEEKEMIYNAEFAYDGINYSTNNIININNNDLHISCFGEYLENKEYIVMQCTGLKDENGKLIYEGDIIEENKSKYVVGYGWNGSYDIMSIDTHNYFSIGTLHTEKTKILGNQYENPKLLENEA